MKNYVQKGDVLTLAAPYDVASGDGLLVGALFAVATGAALAGQEVEAITVDVHDLPKVPTQVWAQGAAVYWDNTAKNVTTTVGSNTKIGAAVLPAANPSPFGRVRLNGTV